MGGAGDWIWGLLSAKQALYHWATAPSLQKTYQAHQIAPTFMPLFLVITFDSGAFFLQDTGMWTWMDRNKIYKRDGAGWQSSPAIVKAGSSLRVLPGCSHNWTVLWHMACNQPCCHIDSRALLLGLLWCLIWACTSQEAERFSGFRKKTVNFLHFSCRRIKTWCLSLWIRKGWHASSQWELKQTRITRTISWEVSEVLGMSGISPQSQWYS